jgi:hypothetical protein
MQCPIYCKCRILYYCLVLRPGTMLTNITVPGFMGQFSAIKTEKSEEDNGKDRLCTSYFNGAQVWNFHPSVFYTTKATIPEIKNICKKNFGPRGTILFLKGVQVWEFFARFFYTNWTHLDMWHRDWEKNQIFITWPLSLMVFGLLPHAECALNPKKIFCFAKL